MACRTVRFVIGTSTAGWTADDCDYLCDGAADQVEINAAITALPSTGGEIVLLDGTYTLSAAIAINKHKVTLRGSGDSTILTGTTGIAIKITSTYARISDMQIQNVGTGVESNAGSIYSRICRCRFVDCTTAASMYGIKGCRFCDNDVYSGELYLHTTHIVTGNHFGTSATITLNGGGCVFVGNHGSADALCAAGDRCVLVGNFLSTSVTVSGTGGVNQNNAWT